MKRTLIAVLALAVLAAACGDDAEGSQPDGATISETQPVTITGDPLPTFPEAGADPAVGMAMPEVEGASFDGTPISITNDGRPKVILIVTHWCPHCRSEVEEYAAAFGSDGLPGDVDVYSVSTSPDPNAQYYPPSEWLGGQDWPVPVIADSAGREIALAVGLTAFPYSVFVYADGTVAARATGAIPYEAFVDAVQFLADHPTAGS
ncbi:MAG: TlpA family protein disulfide reductase [Actinobacteria bacterium]|nr:TlpA family protein disulfide reductase [Actinomycetota bacterium]